jgi:hypothetical protein
MRRNFKPTLNSLESRALLSHMTPHHKSHQVNHVRPHAEVAPPHQNQHNRWTGTLISGSVTITGGGNDVSNNPYIMGAGPISVARVQQNSVGVTLFFRDFQLGKMSLFDKDSKSLLTADIVTLADGSAGNYTITSADGIWAGAKGTGIFTIHDQGDGNLILSFNPHQ